MNKKESYIILTILTFIFLLVAPGTIYYSQGYRLSFDKNSKQFRIFQVGGIAFEIDQSGANISIDKKQDRKEVSGGKKILIDNLKPGIHNFLIEKEGFQPWSKNLEIYEKQVTDAKNIVLFQNKYKFQDFEVKDLKNISDFFEFPDKNKLTLLSRTDDTWNLTIYNPSNKAQESIFNTSSSIAFNGIEFLSEDKAIINAGKDFVAINLKKKIQKSFNIKKDAQSFLYEIPTSSPAIASTSLAYQIIDNNMIYFAKDGIVYKTDLSGKNSSQLTKEKIDLVGIKDAKIIILDRNIFFIASGNLYILDQVRGQLLFLQDNVEDIILSPDKKKVAINAKHEIMIFYLQEQSGQLHYDKGQKVFLDRFSQKISNLQWLDDFHLIANFDNNIKAMSIDNRDTINIAQITDFPSSRFLFLPELKKIIVSSNNKIIISQEQLIQ
ncbi:hypothetical protein KBC01_02150 [Candidatus Parcubacteria bacterium]|nr:hypothetical protein [Candidatus Parcubacteria bacterium]